MTMLFVLLCAYLPVVSLQQLDAKAKKAAEIAAAKRAAELALKNPNTAAWDKHQERKLKHKEVVRGTENDGETYLQVHQEKIFRKRNERVEKRQDRRENRKKIDLVKV
jgi:hypothetical protein